MQRSSDDRGVTRKGVVGHVLAIALIALPVPASIHSQDMYSGIAPGIFYYSAARFLRLGDEEIVTHHKLDASAARSTGKDR